MTNFWLGKRVIVTGASGFLGKHLVRLLKQADCNLFMPKPSKYDLRDWLPVEKMLRNSEKFFAPPYTDQIDILFHLAANVGGIGYNQNNPYNLFFDNAIMGINLIHSCVGRVGKFVQVGTACSYPKYCPEPFHELNFWNGYPEETNAPYGLAKKMLLVQLQAAKQQYGFNGIYPVLTNLYGPGDSFDPEKSHVIPAIIKKFVDAKEQGLDKVELWGTGNATREFLYVEDAAKALMVAAEKHNDCDPINIGSGDYLRIAALAKVISDLVEFEGEIVWDTDKPDGQPRRWLRTLDFWQMFDWQPEMDLKIGLKKTIEWYKENRKVYA